MKIKSISATSTMNTILLIHDRHCQQDYWRNTEQYLSFGGHGMAVLPHFASLILYETTHFSYETTKQRKNETNFVCRYSGQQFCVMFVVSYEKESRHNLFAR